MQFFLFLIIQIFINFNTNVLGIGELIECPFTANPLIPESLINLDPVKRNLCRAKHLTHLCLLEKSKNAPFIVVDKEPVHMPQLCTDRGYNCISHQKYTEDGYYLTVHHLKCNKTDKTECKGAALLMHGLACSSADWTMNDNALPFKLHDEGYDVFMGNMRGNFYSDNHRTLSTKNNSFWDFTFHEMGQYDIPAYFELIRDVMGSPEPIFYVCHSMGCAQMYVALSLYPELNTRIKKMFALAPATILTHMTSSARLISPYVFARSQAAQRGVGSAEFMPKEIHEEIYKRGSVFCSSFQTRVICENVMFVIAGYNPCQMDSKYVPDIVGNSPTRTSIHTVAHLLENAHHTTFKRFNNGPEYDLSKVTVETYVYYGDGDSLVPTKDAENFCKNTLKNANCTPKHMMDSQWSHLDFTYGKDAYNNIYKEMIDKYMK